MMNKKEKGDLIVRLSSEGKTWDYITHEAKVSPNTISKVLANDEESRAFQLFKKGHLPTDIKIELGISPESAAKHYLAYNKLVDLIDLAAVYRHLGANLPDFLDFYNSAKLSNITPHNMVIALNLAKNSEFVRQENLRAYDDFQKTRNAIIQETKNLDEIRRQTHIAADYLQKTKNQLELLNSAVDTIKKSSDYLELEKLIQKAVNTFSSEQYFLVEAALIAVMRKVQKEPNLMPLLQFAFPNKLDMTAHSEYHQFTLAKLISGATKFMPETLDELTTLIEIEILKQIQHFNAVDNANDANYEQYLRDTSSTFQLEGHFEVGKIVSNPQIEKNEKLNTKSIAPNFVYTTIMNIISNNDMDSWWYYYI